MAAVDLSADPIVAPISMPAPGPPSSLPPACANEAPTHQVVPARLADALLLIYADALDDFERTRIATENRVRALRDVKGLADSPEEARLALMVDGLRQLENQAALELKRALRSHPLGPWVKRSIGIGEKQGARLLAAIRDPYWNHAANRPRRGPAELWAYCGYHVLHPGHNPLVNQDTVARVDSLGPDQHCADDHLTRVGADLSHTVGHGSCDSHGVAGVAPRRARGQRANWNAQAKMRAFLVAESCIKQHTSPYRADYDNGRAKYADTVHNQPCARCGPAGKPAATGTPLNDGHKHARALRLVAKAVLRDLWIEAKRLHEETS